MHFFYINYVLGCSFTFTFSTGKHWENVSMKDIGKVRYCRTLNVLSGLADLSGQAEKAIK